MCVCVDDNGPLVNITAVLGHTATFKCPNQKSGTVTRLYIQKVVDNSDDKFVNGFDLFKKLDVPPEYQNRTKMNQTNLSMEMTNVSVSDEGLYKCVVFYHRVEPFSVIYLKVTGMAQDTQTSRGWVKLRTEESAQFQLMSVNLNLNGRKRNSH